MTPTHDSRTLFRWPVSHRQRFPAPPEKVWGVISSPGNLLLGHPFCRENPVESWPGVGSRDSVHYYSGWVLQREFTHWIDGVGYDLRIGRQGGRTSDVSWRIVEEGDMACTLVITICPHGLQHVPVALRWLPHFAYLGPALKSYLRSVLSGFHSYMATGHPVRRNQFGSHRWFSPTTPADGTA